MLQWSMWEMILLELLLHLPRQGSPFPTAWDGPGQVKLPVGQVDLDKFFFFISYKQIEEFQSRASDDFEKRRALQEPMS